MRKSFAFVALSLVLPLTACSFGISSYSRTASDPYGNWEWNVSPDPTLQKKTIRQTYKDYEEGNIYPLNYCPSTGSAKLLVIPVWFTDSNQCIALSSRENVRADIEQAYFGSPSNIGWHSVKSYYETESMGRLSLSGTVSSWYECGLQSGAVATDLEATGSLVKSAADWYFSANPSDSRRNYDCDGDGYLDGVMLIYALPDYAALNNANASNLWAYAYWLMDESVCNRNNPGANGYFWASYDFMYDAQTAQARTAKSSYASGDATHCTVDAHTFIHEMGHVFGLEDYYDYGEGGYCPAGGFSMQDYNVGGHDPFSVMALGWTEPYIPTQSCSITISAFQKSHEVILLTPSWNEFDSAFDEYFLLELYTPMGLNAFDSAYAYQDAYPQGPIAAGIRLWHVDARLAYCDSVHYEGGYAVPDFSDRQITCDAHQNCRYGVTHAFSNTYGNSEYGSVLGTRYENANLLQLIRNDPQASYRSNKAFAAGDLFGHDSFFDINTFGRQLPNNGVLDSGRALGWRFKVYLSGQGEDVQAEVRLVRV